MRASRRTIIIAVVAHVLMLANPISGRGSALDEARSVAEHLDEAGHTVALEQTRTDADPGWLRALLPERHVVVVAGGDGAVRAACGAMAGADAALYHLPCGTENLFARDWGMDRDPDTLLRAIDAGNVVRIDLGRIQGQPFVLMASVGLDAEVIDDLTTSRQGSISHRSYVGPIWRQWRRWRPPSLKITVDGVRIDGDLSGMVVVGNSRQYAMRLDPALRADLTDGRLDVVFLPMRSRWRALRWALAMRTRRHLRHRDLVYERGRHVEIEADEPFRYQLDGERPEDGLPVRSLVIDLEPATVPVLKPVPASDYRS